MGNKAYGLYVMFILSYSSIDGRKSRKVLLDTEQDVEDYGADAFCKRQGRLVRTAMADEIVVVDTFPGNSILLQCKYCEEKDTGLPRTWHWQEHIFTGNITEIEPSMEDNYGASHSFVTKDHSLVLRNVQNSDLGLYFCKTPYANSPKETFNYLVDFMEKMNDDVKGSVTDFKNYTQHYIKRISEVVSGKKFSERTGTRLKVLTEWSDWSECDSYFRKEGIRYRMGKCKLKFFSTSVGESKDIPMNYTQFNDLTFGDEQNTEKTEYFDSVAAVKENIMNLNIALSCKSYLLRKLNPDIYNVTHKTPDFMLTEKCNIPYSGRSSKKGPRYKKSIILATGAHLTLVCPDSTIDSRVEWEHDQVRLWPNEGTDYVVKTGEPRLYVDSFNTLYLFEVTEKESGNYTCFVDGLRMQEVKIIVLTRSLFFTKEFTRHLKYLGYVFILCFFAYLLGLLITCVKIQTENRIKKAFGKEEVKKLTSPNKCDFE